MAHKYGAKKVTIDGITFDSKAESIYYQLHKHEPNMKMKRNLSYKISSGSMGKLIGKFTTSQILLSTMMLAT